MPAAPSFVQTSTRQHRGASNAWIGVVAAALLALGPGVATAVAAPAAFVDRRGALGVIDEAGGAVRTDRDALAASATPDGRLVVATTGSVRVVDARGRASAALRLPGGRRVGARTAGPPVWSPGGREVAFLGRRTTRSRARLVRCVAATGRCTDSRIAGSIDRIDDGQRIVAWSPQLGPLVSTVRRGALSPYVVPDEPPRCRRGQRRTRTTSRTGQRRLLRAPASGNRAWTRGIALEGVVDPPELAGAGPAAQALVLGDRTLVVDTPKAWVDVVATCRRRPTGPTRRSLTATIRATGYDQRVRVVDAAGRATPVALPAAALRGGRLSAVRTADGGALLLARAVRSQRTGRVVQGARRFAIAAGGSRAVEVPLVGRLGTRLDTVAAVRPRTTAEGELVALTAPGDGVSSSFLALRRIGLDGGPSDARTLVRRALALADVEGAVVSGLRDRRGG